MKLGAADSRRQTESCFLAYAGEPSRLRRLLSALVPERHTPLRLNRVLDCNELVIYASPETPHRVLARDKGLLIGRVKETEICGESGGFGDVCAALIRGDRTVSVSSVRGASRIFHCQAEGVQAYSSHAEIVREAMTQRSLLDPIEISELPPGHSHRTRNGRVLTGTICTP